VSWKEDLRQDREAPGDKNWEGENAPFGTAIQYHLASAASGGVDIRIVDVVSGEVVRDIVGSTHQGLNRVQWNLETNPEPDPDDPDDEPEGQPVEPGLYRVHLEVGGVERTAVVRVLEDRWMTFP